MTGPSPLGLWRRALCLTYGHRLPSQRDHVMRSKPCAVSALRRSDARTNRGGGMKPDPIEIRVTADTSELEAALERLRKSELRLRYRDARIDQIILVVGREGRCLSRGQRRSLELLAFLSRSLELTEQAESTCESAPAWIEVEVDGKRRVSIEDDGGMELQV